MVQRIWATADVVAVDMGAGSNGLVRLSIYSSSDRIVFQAIVCRLLFKLSLRDHDRMFLMGG
jgi:hypothetical protein